MCAVARFIHLRRSSLQSVVRRSFFQQLILDWWLKLNNCNLNLKNHVILINTDYTRFKSVFYSSIVLLFKNTLAFRCIWERFGKKKFLLNVDFKQTLQLASRSIQNYIVDNFPLEQKYLQSVRNEWIIG